jgi:predicted metal-dependent HD superfamily phosphohydrolase
VPLRNRFKKVCDSLAIESDGYYEILDDLYRGRLRFYHDWDHIESVLDRIDELAEFVVTDGLDLNLVRFAAFYHDAIYVPGFDKNELLSAYLSEAHLLTGGTTYGKQVGQAHRWIMATKNHQPNESDLGARLLCDADLYELGTERYGINGLNVRREFGAFSDHDWKKGRRLFLRGYCGRDKLFSLPGQAAVERAARSNMKQELALLKA